MSPSLQLPTVFASTRRIDSLPDLGPKRLLVESIPIAAVVAFWGVLAAVVNGGLSGTAVRLAAVAMGGAYALARGWQLATDNDADGLPGAPRSLVRASVTPMIACVAWIVAGAVLEALTMGLWHSVGSLLLAPEFQFVVSGFLEVGEFVGAVTGFLSVVLYAVVFARTHAVAGHAQRDAGESTAASSSED